MNRQQIFNNLGIIILTLAILGLTVLLLGPFQGQESGFGLSDKEAHFLAFYTLTIIALNALQKIRKLDILFFVIIFGLFTEVAQFMTGRSMSIFDLMADTGGALAATLPLFSRERKPNFDVERRSKPW